MPEPIAFDTVKIAAEGWVTSWCKKCEEAVDPEHLAEAVARCAIGEVKTLEGLVPSNIWVVTALGIVEAAQRCSSGSASRLVLTLGLGHLLINLKAHAHLYFHESLFGSTEADSSVLEKLHEMYKDLASAFQERNAALFAEIKPLQGKVEIVHHG